MYNLILADPPWRYGWAHGNGAAEHHYPTMATEDIAALPVARLAADPCILILWGTWPLLPAALAVINGWGFEYKTLAWVWIKRNPTNIGMFMGTGQYTRQNSEYALLAVRGRGHTLRQDAGVLSILEAAELDDQGLPLDPRLGDIMEAPRRQHSRKPDEQYRLINQLVGDETPRLELFARRRMPYWDAWGHGVTGDQTLDAFAEARNTGAASPL